MYVIYVLIASLVAITAGAYPSFSVPELAVTRLPETTKTSFGQPVFRKNKGQVARDCPAFATRTTWIFFNFEHWFL